MKLRDSFLILFLWSLSLGVMPGASPSIREIDFKNFSYPFYTDDFPGVPGQLTWLPLEATRLVGLVDGRYRFQCDANLPLGRPKTMKVLGNEVPMPDPCPTLTGVAATFGQLEGLAGTAAIVEIGYHTGGTAHWSYVYVVAMQSGKPHVVAWLEAGSRADMGVRNFRIDRGDLVLIVNDPDQRQGDCCSLGTLTYRYRWQRGSFRQIGAPVQASDPPQRR